MVDTRVKERLTGAIILVAFLVLLVPELLTGPSRSAPADHAANVEEGETLRTYTIDLANGSGALRPASASATVPEASSLTAATPVAVDSEITAAEGTAEHSDPVTPSNTVASAAPADGSTSGAAGSIERTPARSAAAASEEAAPVARASASEAPPVAGWMVQVGSFASRENADRLARQLKGKGFAAFVKETSNNGRRLYRVRIGPEAERDAAIALRAKLRSAGQPGATVLPYP